MPPSGSVVDTAARARTDARRAREAARLKTIAVVVVVIVAVVLGFALTKPDTFSVQRAARIKAPPEKIFAILNDFRRWPEWSP